MKKLLLIFVFFAVFALPAFGQSGGESLALGNPSGAQAKISDANNYLVAHGGYTLSYNKSRGAANWVAWHLSQSDIGAVERSNAFAPDTLLPRDWGIKPNDYSGSGYDRGHLCPSKDRSNTDAANRETFLMSNMQPQAPKLNQKTWRYLEDYERKLASRGNEEYFFAGCYGDKGKISGKITIPTNCWKIIVVLPEGEDDLKRIDKTTRVIAVDMPNDETISQRWRTYLTTVDDIEEQTGYDFLAKLPKKIQKIIESARDQNSETSSEENEPDEAAPAPATAAGKTPTGQTSGDTTKSGRKTSSGGRTYVRGPRGGCYYLSDSGKKVYVSDKNLCQ